MSDSKNRADELRELSELNDSAAKRFFDTLARITAVSILLHLSRTTHNLWITILAAVAGVALIGWLGAWVVLRGFELMARNGFPHRSHHFPAALSFAVQVVLIGLSLWGAWTLAPELMKALATAALTKP